MVGIQVPKGTSEAFEVFLGDLGYPYIDETEHPVYQQFFK